MSEDIRKDEARLKRGQKWDSTFIACIRHPERRCSRSRYIMTRNRYCRTCDAKRADGSDKPHYAKRGLVRSLKRRAKVGPQPKSMSVLQIAEKIINGQAIFPRR